MDDFKFDESDLPRLKLVKKKYLAEGLSMVAGWDGGKPNVAVGLFTAEEGDDLVWAVCPADQVLENIISGFYGTNKVTYTQDIPEMQKLAAWLRSYADKVDSMIDKAVPPNGKGISLDAATA